MRHKEQQMRTLVICTMLLCSHASACYAGMMFGEGDTLYVNRTMDVTGWQETGAGEFALYRGSDDLFLGTTFCLDPDEPISVGMRMEVLGFYDVTPESDWLFGQYRDGAFSRDYDTMLAVQRAFWMAEGTGEGSSASQAILDQYEPGPSRGATGVILKYGRFDHLAQPLIWWDEPKVDKPVVPEPSGIVIWVVGLVGPFIWRRWGCKCRL